MAAKSIFRTRLGIFAFCFIFIAILICPKGGEMKIIVFIEDYEIIYRINSNLELTFGAERPPQPQVLQ